MQMRPLGQSSIEASVVGLGTWAIGGWMWGTTDESQSVDAIAAALDAGINLIDTAPMYGFGLSETLIGKAIRKRRDQVILATKCSMVCDPTVGEHKFNSNALGPDPNGIIAIHICLKPESIRRELEGSLKRLRTDHLDLLQTHWQESTTPIEETMGELMKMKEEGKIRAIGVCNASVEHMEAYSQVGPLDSDQEKYSMLDRQLEEDQLPWCHKNNVAMLAYSPLALGLLTGKISSDRQFDVGDQRRTNPRFMRANLQRINDALEKIRPVAEQHQATLAQTVIAWTVHQPGVTHALVGARNPQQAQENAAAGSIKLTADQLATIDAAVAEMG